MPRSRALIACSLALSAAACGPIGATSVIGGAEVATARAHAADGDKYATYETTAADLYLQKAREEQGYAHYSAAMDLAEKSTEYAEAATKKAGEAKKDPNAQTSPPPAKVERAPEASPAPRVVKPGDAPPPEPPKPPPPPKSNEPVRPVETAPAPSTEEPRRVIKPGEPMPSDAPPKKPKAPIDVEQPK
jgi:hypothetical protein